MSVRIACTLLFLAGMSSTPVIAQGIVYDDELSVVSCEDVSYPVVARSARVEGDVVISVALNDDGSVKSVEPLSGPRLLVSTAVDNARKWKFGPNTQRRAIIVYEFRVAGTCGNGARNLFRLFPPNIASVSACVPFGQSDGAR